MWLAGVRRAGKTCLCQSLPDIEYFDCELPRVRRLMDDPESFLERLRGKRIVLDEVHRLPNPSELLKIAADHYPTVSVLATGSSTLGASSRFRDTLTGRKRDVSLTPMTWDDLRDFGNEDLEHRMLRGGLPPFFLSEGDPNRDIQDWVDAYWAKDIQELFRLERKSSFQRFLELLLSESGAIFEATRFAVPCEVSRATISNYLGILEATYVVHVVRPFTTRRASEIVAAPRVYAFDTGFFCAYRDWRVLRPEDRGTLWEHLVLNELTAVSQTRRIAYWRDKRGHEVDFVWAPRAAAPLAIECKWAADRFDPTGLAAFRRIYAKGDNVVVAHDVESPFERSYGDLKVRFESLPTLAGRLAAG